MKRLLEMASVAVVWMTVFSVIFGFICVVAAEAQLAPLPAGQEVIEYDPVQHPAPGLQAASAKPVGVGTCRRDRRQRDPPGGSAAVLRPC